jgi:hypothetical protein
MGGSARDAEFPPVVPPSCDALADSFPYGEPCASVADTPHLSNKEQQVIHPYLSETLAKMRIDDLRREAALYRRASRVARNGRKRVWRSASRATKESLRRQEGGEPCAEC